MIIYGLCDSRLPGIIRYVGQAINPRQRLQNHIRQPGKTYKGNWIRKVLAEGGAIEQVFIAFAVSQEAADILERFYIKLFRDLGFSLTNLSEGGGGRLGFHPSIESINKTASSHVGRKRSVDTCARISAAKRGVSLPAFTKEHKERIAASNRNKQRPYLVALNKIPWTAERRAKQSASQVRRWERFKEMRHAEKKIG